ncbi:hypothetical protein FOMPIDRAFT_1097576, partial [Fomitopsis schrenkii]
AALLFVLMVIKVYSYRPLNELPILLRVLRDGTIYYFVTNRISVLVSSASIPIQSPPWISAILSFSGAHLLLSLRTLAAERVRADIATPDISEDVPDISVPDGDAPQSPMEFHELAPAPPRPTPALPRPA